MNEKELFNEVFKNFSGIYNGLELKHYYYGDVVRYKGEDKFNTEGYNLLYNLKRLCDLLEDELR